MPNYSRTTNPRWSSSCAASAGRSRWSAMGSTTHPPSPRPTLASRSPPAPARPWPPPTSPWCTAASERSRTRSCSPAPPAGSSPEPRLGLRLQPAARPARRRRDTATRARRRRDGHQLGHRRRQRTAATALPRHGQPGRHATTHSRRRPRARGHWGAHLSPATAGAGRSATRSPKDSLRPQVRTGFRPAAAHRTDGPA
jgi:hypothetical protein